jgi:deoxyribose-phosphate aldolase
MPQVITATDIAARIDHTLLKPDMTFEDLKRLVEEARTHQFAAICVPPFFAQDAVKQLEGSLIKVATVVGFPMGYSPTIAKVEETKNCLDKEVHEIDAVVNIAAIKSKKWSFVNNDIQSITTAVHLQGKVIKMIIETGLLSADELKKVCELCANAGVDYVKTSTGFHGQGATVDVVAKMRKLLPSSVKIKASGGIRTREFALELLEAGADRLGTSSSLEIIGA